MKAQSKRHRSQLLVAIAAVATLGTHTFATSATWDQTGSGTFSWNVNTDPPWAGAVFPGTTAGDSATVASALTAAETINLNQNITLGTLNLGASTAFSFTIAKGTAGQLTLNNGGAGASIVQNSASNGDTISAPIVIADTLSNTISNSSASKTFTITGGVTGSQPLILQANAAGAILVSTTSINNAGAITNSGSGSGTVTISSNLGASVTGVTQNSANSTLVLSGTNTADTLTYTVSAGTLQGTGGASFGANATINLANTAGATLALSNSGFTIGSLTGGGSTGGTVTHLSTITFGGTNVNSTYAGSITGSGDLVWASTFTGTQTLSGAITYTGNSALTIQGGTVVFGSGATVGNGTLSTDAYNLVTSNAANFTENNGATVADIPNGIVQGSTGTMTINGIIGTNQGITVSSGNLVIGSTGNISSAQNITQSGTGTLTEASGGNISSLDGNGGLAVNAGTATINSSANSYKGGTTVGQGTLILGANALGNFSTTGTTGNASTSITGVASTVGLVVGESITGANIKAGTTIASFTSNTITLSQVTNATTGTASTLTIGQFGALGDSQSGGTATLGSATLTGGAAILTSGAYTIGRNITEKSASTNSSLSIGGNQTSGTSAYTGNIGLTGTTTLTSAAGGEVDFTTGVISNNTGSQNVIISGGGLVKLTGANTFGSATAHANSVTVTGGSTLNLGGAVNTASLGAAGNDLIFNNGIFQFTAATPFDLSATRTITLNSGGATIDTNGNAVTFGSSIGNGGTGTLTLSDSNGTPGSLTLSANNTYTGGTVVNKGTLNVSGIGTLGGTSGSLTVNTNGNLNLGGTSQSVGRLGGTGGFIYNNGSGVSTLTVGTGNGTGGNYAGAIENNTGTGGSVALSKTGTGTITLSGANTFTGATAVTNGALALGAGGSLGGTNVTLSGTGNLQVGQLNSSAATILGTSGAATLTINSGGTLSFVNGIAGASSTLADNFNINNSTAGATALTLAGGTLNIGVGGSTGSDEVVLGAGLLANVSGSTTIDLNIISTLNGSTQQLLSWGASPLGGGNFSIGTVNGLSAGGYTLSLSETSSGLFLVESSVSSAYWKGSQGSSWATGLPGGSSNFTTDLAGTTNRTASLDSQTSVVFTATGGTNFSNTTLDGSPTIDSLTFNVGGVGIAPGSGGTLTIAASGTAISVATGLGAVTETISSNVAMGSSQTWTVGDAASSLVVSGNVSGSGENLTKAGNGTLVLSGVNSYSGTTSVLAGNLSIQSADALDGTSGVSVTSGASLQLQGGFSTTTATSLGLSGSGVSGQGALDNVSGSNTYSGAISLAAPSSIGSDAGYLSLTAANLNTNGFTLTLVGVGSGDISSSINTGALTMSGTGTWTIDGFNNYSGVTTVNAGTLQLGSSGFGTLGSGSNDLTVNGGTLDLNGNNLTAANLSGTGGTITNNNSGTEVFLQIGSGSSGSYSGSITNGATGGAFGPGIIDLYKQGSGVTTLSGADTYTGLTSITGGALNIASNGALGTNQANSTSSVTVSSGAALQLSGGITTAAAVPTTLTGSGVSAAPNGALENVSGNNTFTGPITLAGVTSIGSDAGTLNLSSTATIGGTGNLTFIGGGNGNIAGAISTGSSTVTVSSSGTWTPTGTNTTGTWTFSGANTYTGATFVTNGTLAFNSPSALVNSVSLNLGSSTANTTAALNYTGSGATVTNALNFTGNQTVALANSGTGAVIYSATPSFGAGNKTLVLGNTTDTVGGTIGGIVNGSTGTTSLIKTGAINSTWILNGTNTYTGTTTINGGVLQIATASALTSGNLVLSGTGAVSNSVLQTQGTLNLTIGTNLSWGGTPTAGAGFSAIGGTLNLNINSGAPLNWGTNGFSNGGGAVLAFGSSTSNAQVILPNAINLNTGDGFQQNVYVAKGVGGDSTLFSGVISGGTSTGAASGLTKVGGGTLILSNASNSYSGYTAIEGGTLVAEARSPVTAATTTAATTGVFGSGYGAYGGTTPTTGYSTIYVGTNQGGSQLGGVINPTLMIGGNFTIANPIAIDWNNASSSNQVFGIGGYLNANSTFSGPVTLNGGAATGNTFAVTQVATTGSNALNITGGITATNGGNINFANVGAVNVSTTGITNGSATAVSVTQTGTGTTRFSAASTYSGGTTVSAGALILNNTSGSGIGTGALSMGANTTLAGTGSANTTLASNYTINGGATSTRATVLVGQNAATANTDTNVASNLSLKTAGTLAIANANLTFNLNMAASGGSGLDGTQNVNNSGNELLVGASAVSFGTTANSVALTLNLQNTAAPLGPSGTPFVLFAGTGSTSTATGLSTGQYANLNLGSAVAVAPGITENIISTTNLSFSFGTPGAAAAYGANSVLVLYQNSNTGVDDIDVEVVPEPGTWAMLLGGLALLILIRRRTAGSPRERTT
jgi:fibronectin-binding autotransporter adhesin